MIFYKNFLFIFINNSMEKQPINTDDSKEIKTTEVKVENTVENTIENTVSNNEPKDNTNCEYDNWFAE